MNIQSQPPQHATPPESLTSSPLTPPPTDEKSTSQASRIIRDIRNHQEGRNLTSVPWASYKLDVKGYEELLHRFQDDKSLCGFAELRYDYFPSANLFVLRMPTALHETFIADIVEEIQIQLKSIPGPAALFAKEISSRGSTSIKFRDEEYGKHDPDAQFQHLEASYPGIVIEVSYSQKRKDLARLADDYILGSDSDIRAVVGLDIEYSANKEATLSIWRPNIETNDVGEKELVVQQTITNQVFRDGNGKPSVSRTGGLQLRLRDFATEDLTQPNGPLRDPIFISANTLCSFLEHAEHKAFVATQQTSIITSAKPWVRKRRRELTPLEELKHNDEKRFRVDENRAADQATKDDSSYKTGSTSETESN